jgi:hypothetical protein
MKRFLVTILIVAGLYEFGFVTLSHFITLDRGSFAFGAIFGIIILSITEWISNKFDKAEEVEQKDKEDEKDSKISSDHLS